MGAGKGLCLSPTWSVPSVSHLCFVPGSGVWGPAPGWQKGAVGPYEQVGPVPSPSAHSEEARAPALSSCILLRCWTAEQNRGDWQVQAGGPRELCRMFPSLGEARRGRGKSQGLGMLWGMMELSRGSLWLIHYHTLAGLEQQTFILSQFWKSEAQSHFTGQKPKCWQGHTPSRGSEGSIFLLPPAPGGCWHSLACGYPSVLFL